MGGEQAASTLLDVKCTALKREGHEPDAAELEELRHKVEAGYDDRSTSATPPPASGSTRIIEPADSRATLLTALEVATRYDDGREFKTGVLQV